MQQRSGVGVYGAGLDGAASKYSDPHAEIGCLFDKNVLLRGEEPKQVAAPDLVPAAADEVGSTPPGNEVQLEFRMVMTTVRRREIGILPDAAIQLGRKLKMLKHDKK